MTGQYGAISTFEASNTGHARYIKLTRDGKPILTSIDSTWADLEPNVEVSLSFHHPTSIPFQGVIRLTQAAYEEFRSYGWGGIAITYGVKNETENDLPLESLLLAKQCGIITPDYNYLTIESNHADLTFSATDDGQSKDRTLATSGAVSVIVASEADLSKFVADILVETNKVPTDERELARLVLSREVYNGYPVPKTDDASRFA